MAEQNRFQVRQTTAELKELDEALVKLGYRKSDGTANRADWFRDMKRQSLNKAKSLNKIY